MITQAAEWTSPPADEDDFLAWLRTRRDIGAVQEEPGTGDWHIFTYPEAMAALADYSALSNAKSEALGIAPMPTLDEAIRLYMEARSKKIAPVNA